jgi:hypothetical protein
MLLISPIIFIAPYKIAKFPSKAEKIIFIILGLVAPYIAIYLSFVINHVPFASGPQF